MGTKTITMYVSDIDRSEIPEGEAYQLSIRHPDGSTQQLDISAKNYRDLRLEGLGKTLKKRGRKPGSTSRTAAATRRRANSRTNANAMAETACGTLARDARAGIGAGVAVSGTALAGRAHPENIGLVVGDGESVAVRHPRRPQVHSAGVDLDHPAAAAANQMVMVHGIAEAEQRLAGFTPEHVHPARLHQPLEGPVHGGQAHRMAKAGVKVLGRQGLGGPAQRLQHGRALPGDARRLGNSAVDHGGSSLPRPPCENRPRARCSRRRLPALRPGLRPGLAGGPLRPVR